MTMLEASDAVPTGRYLGKVYDVDADAATAVVDLVRIDGTEIRNDGSIPVALRSEFRRFWRWVFPPSQQQREPVAEATQAIFERFDYGIVELAVAPESVKMLTEWSNERTWTRLHVREGAIVAAEAVQPRVARQLDRTFGSADWRYASAAEANQLLSELPDPDTASVLNVGQGLCVGFAESPDAGVSWYFDVGLGYGRNIHRDPSGTSFCTCRREELVVILSHWHKDHWERALTTPGLTCARWVVPNQSTGPMASKLAADIATHGRLLVVKHSSRPTASTGNICLRYATGKSINDSGLALLVRRAGQQWLFPADAAYAYLPPGWLDCAGLQVTHHGAAVKLPVPTPVGTDRFVVFSYGVGNSYRHPASSTWTDLQGTGWTDADRRDTSGPLLGGPAGAVKLPLNAPPWTHLQQHGVVFQ